MSVPIPLPWGEILVGSAQAAHKAGLFKKLVALLKSRRKILVLGASGVGKSEFINSIKKEIIKAIPREERTVWTDNVKLIIDNLPFLFIDTPGHIEYKDERMNAIEDALLNGVTGIINVVCDGYHETDIAYDTFLEKSKQGVRVKPDFLEKNRKIELRMLGEWTSLVHPNRVKWIITLISKADIWWPDEDGSIHKFYKKGTYHNKIPQSVLHCLAPYSSTIEPFYGIFSSGKFGSTKKSQARNYLIKLLITGARVKK